MNTKHYSPKVARYIQTVVDNANDISIATAVFQGSLHDRPTERPTDHAIDLFTDAQRV